MSRGFIENVRITAGVGRGRTGAGRSGWLRVVSLLHEAPWSKRAGNISSDRRAGDGPDQPDQL